MPTLIIHISKPQQNVLFKQLYYLNIEEYTELCTKFSIPISIFIKLPNGKLKKTIDKDRKGVILKKLKDYISTGRTQKPTVLSSKIVKPLKGSSALTPDSPIFYGTYDRNDTRLWKLLSELTNGKFKDGAIARHVIRDFWTKGKAPSVKQFTKAWKKAIKDHGKPKPEWAYLTDLVSGMTQKDWKSYRVKQSKAALKILNGL